MLGRYNYASARPGLARHIHCNAMEFCYLVKGRQKYRVGFRDYTLKGGDVFLTFPNEQHDTGDAPEEKGVLYWLILRMPKLRHPFLGDSSPASRCLVERLLRIRERHFPGTPIMKRLFDEMLVLQHRRNHPFRRLAIKARLVDFLLEVAASAERQARPGPSAVINAVLRHIDSRLHEPITMSELAAQAKLSESRFKTRFKREVGIPPADCVLRRKIDAAKGLLRAQNASVTDVAFRLGFSSSQYFATVFRRYTGRRPRDFQRS